MKKFFLVLTFIVIAVLNSESQQVANKLKWYTLKEAVELQKTQPRKILIDIYTDWCGWCKRMDAETFTNQVITDLVSKNFYPVKFNAESKDSIVFGGHTFINDSHGGRSTHQFAMALFQAQNMQPGYPSIAYLDEKFQLIRVWSGYWTAQQLEIWLNYLVEEKYKPLPLEEYQKTFKSKISQ